MAVIDFVRLRSEVKKLLLESRGGTYFSAPYLATDANAAKLMKHYHSDFVRG